MQHFNPFATPEEAALYEHEPTARVTHIGRGVIGALAEIFADAPKDGEAL